MNFKAISISLIPNFGKEELKLARRLYWKESRGDKEKELKLELKKYFNREVSLTENGRLAMYLLLRAWGVGSGDEVIVQAFTCSVVVAAIKGVGAKPVFVDIDENYNIDLSEAEKKISKKTKVLIVQHSFGKAVEMERVIKMVKGKKIFILEDLAHGFGNSYKGKKLGCWGDGAIMSFGRDKVISAMWGGGVLGSEKTIKKVEEEMREWPVRDRAWTKKQLVYVWWIEIVLRWYRFFGVGKMWHLLGKRMGVLSEPISLEEKRGEIALKFKGMRPEMAELVLCQLKKIEGIIKERKKAAKYYALKLGGSYDEKCSYLRYTIEVKEAVRVRERAARRGVFLGDWYDQVIAPKSIDVTKFGYRYGSCPIAEEKCLRVINLPTNPNSDIKDWQRVVKLIKNEDN